MTLHFAGTPDARLKETAMSEHAEPKPKTVIAWDEASPAMPFNVDGGRTAN
jgi:hypothetical protein